MKVFVLLAVAAILMAVGVPSAQAQQIIVNPGCAANPLPTPSTGKDVRYVDANGNACTVTSSDPCDNPAKLTANFSSTTSGASIVNAAASKKIYVCQVTMIISAAAAVSFVEGTGASVCTGGTTAGVWLNNTVTAANGAPFASNGGVSAGNGRGTVFQTANVNQNLCLVFTTTNSPTVVASVSYVQQ